MLGFVQVAAVLLKPFLSSRSSLAAENLALSQGLSMPRTPPRRFEASSGTPHEPIEGLAAPTPHDVIAALRKEEQYYRSSIGVEEWAIKLARLYEFMAATPAIVAEICIQSRE